MVLRKSHFSWDVRRGYSQVLFHAIVGPCPGSLHSLTLHGLYFLQSVLQAKVAFPRTDCMVCLHHPLTPVPHDPLIVYKANKITCQRVVGTQIVDPCPQRFALSGPWEIQHDINPLEGIGVVMAITAYT